MKIELFETLCGKIVFKPKGKDYWVFFVFSSEDFSEFKSGERVPENIKIRETSFTTENVCDSCFVPVLPSESHCEKCKEIIRFILTTPI